MALEQLTFATLGDVDHGSIAVAVDQALQQVYRDILDREGLKKSRKVTIELELHPECDQRGDLTFVNVGCSIKTTLPARSTAVVMSPGADGLQFQTDSPQNPHQNTLPFGQREEGPGEE